MKSIRWSLAAFFLLLLLGSLAVVSTWVYRITHQSLLARETSTRQLLEANHKTRCKDERDKLDEQLLHRAQTLVNVARTQWGPRPFQELGALSVGLAPPGCLLIPAWMDGRLFRGPYIKLETADEIMHRDQEESHSPLYFQIYNEKGQPIQRSDSMGDREFVLAPEVLNSLGLLEWRHDDVEWRLEDQPATSLRRVTFKASVSRLRRYYGGPQVFGRPRRPPSQPPPNPPPTQRYEERSSPAIFVQCARSTAALNEKLAGFQDGLNQKVEDLEVDTAASLASLRNRLFWIGLGLSAATMIGGFWLIGVGLAPLRRVSDAVSQVSEKDFQLRVNSDELPEELRPIVDRLAKTLGQLQRAFAREKQAAADISHELRTPLAALTTTIEVALRKQRTVEKYGEVLRDCQTIGKQMSQMVERLMALARLDAGVDQVRPQEVDVAQLAEECVALVRPLAATRELDLNLQCRDPIRVTTDPDKLREILTNLLHNAIEYNRPKGQVDVTVSRENGHVQVAVRDTGIGISADARSSVFERFYRADASRHSDGLHAGLGLSIVQSYTQLLGGSVALESAEGQGSTFRVSLPVEFGKYTPHG